MGTPKRPAGTVRSLRAEIQLSWRRTARSGLQPDRPIDSLDVSDVDSSSRLVVAARPVLAEMAEQLSGTRYAFFLADAECRIVERWFDTPEIERALDCVSAVPGSTFAEDAVGTNGIGTPAEVRHGIVVHGDEHFNEHLKTFSCYGHPIRHPLTNRLEGVLDITGIAEDANPMLAPFLVRAVRDIELRLADGSRVSQRLLMATFQQAVERRTRPVAVVGRDTVLANKAAIDLLDAGDHATLRSLAEAAAGRPERVCQLRLSSGTLVNLRVEPVVGADDGVLFHIDPAARPDIPVPRGRAAVRQEDPVARSVRMAQRAGPAIAVTGEPGSGRTWAINAIAGRRSVRVLYADEVSVVGERAWIERFQSCIDAGDARDGVVAVEDVHLLPDRLCSLVARTVELADRANGAEPDARAWIVLTSVPAEHLTPMVSGVLASCSARVELPPLRNRAAQFPEVIRSIVAELCPRGELRLTPSAVAELAAHPWPGNVRELAALLRRLVRARSAGDITPADLPDEYRGSAKAARLAGRERAERAAIIEALSATTGNKAQAAQRLGISRTTLYSRMRALGVR